MQLTLWEEKLHVETGAWVLNIIVYCILPAANTQLLQHAPQPALRESLFCLNDFLHVIQTFFLQGHKQTHNMEQIVCAWTYLLYILFTIYIWMLSYVLPRPMHCMCNMINWPACQQSYPSCWSCTVFVVGPATSSWCRCTASFQSKGDGSNFCFKTNTK